MMNMLLNLRNTLTARELFTTPRQYLVSSAVAETVFSYPLPAVTVRRGF